MLTGQSPGIESKVMLTLCGVIGRRVLLMGKNVTLLNGKFCKERVYFNFTPCGAGFIINCLNTDIDTFHQESSI